MPTQKVYYLGAPPGEENTFFIAVECLECERQGNRYRTVLRHRDRVQCGRCASLYLQPINKDPTFVHKFVYSREEKTMGDTELMTQFASKPDVTVELRASELSFLIYLLERGGNQARSASDGATNSYSMVCDRLLKKLTDLDGSTEDRFDRAVASIVSR